MVGGWGLGGDGGGRGQRGGTFTNHKRQLYVQIVYKTQSEYSVKSSTIKAQRGSNLCRDINQIQTQVLLKTFFFKKWVCYA